MSRDEISAEPAQEPEELRPVSQPGGTEIAVSTGAPDEDELNLGTKTMQCGRRNDAFKLWAAWKHHGDAGYAAKIGVRRETLWAWIQKLRGVRQRKERHLVAVVGFLRASRQSPRHPARKLTATRVDNHGFGLKNKVSTVRGQASLG